MKLYDIVNEYIEYNLSDAEIKKYQYSYTHQINIQTLYKHFKKQYNKVNISLLDFNNILNYNCSKRAETMEE